jgi:very-short-patch-repair endonuclease
VRRGVYALGPARLSQRGIWLAATLARGPTALLSHASAAALWGLSRPPPGPVHVTIPDTKQPSGRGLTIHRTRRLDPLDRAVRERIPVTALPRTVLDLAETEGPRRLRRAVDEADRLGLLHLGELEAAIERHPGRRGIAPLREILTGYVEAPPTRSELEDRFLDLIREAGLPAPQTNVVVAGMEVDAYWPEARLVVELDGYRYHAGPGAHERDRERTLRLQDAGREVRRFTWRQVTRKPDAVTRSVRKELERDGV